MGEKLTVKQYADYRNVSRQHIYKLISNGQLTRAVDTIGGKTRIDKGLADRELRETLDRVYNPRPRKKAGGGGTHRSKKRPTPPEMEQTAKKAGTQDMTLADAQKLQAQYKAALLKLDYEQKSEQLVEVAKVKLEAFEMARTVRDSILNIPDRISAELASCTDVHEINQKLTVTLTEALEELSAR